VVNRIGGAVAVVPVPAVGEGDVVPPDATFEAFYRSERRRILAVVVLLTGDRAAAEDVVQDAFAAALRRWAVISTYDRPGDWVKRVAVNRAISRFRRGRNERIALERVAGRSGADRPDWGGAEPAEDALWAAVRRLPRRQAQVIALMYVDDQSTRQVAETLGCSVGAVKSHLHRAKHHLAETLAQETTR
jgi:RNA polymerase sigma-70 factor (sigma-E family)